MISLCEFLSAFFPSVDEPIHLRAFPPKGTEVTDENKPRNLTVTRRRLEEDANLLTLLKQVNLHCGLYFVVNSGGHRDEEITRYNAVFTEADDKSIEEQHRRLDASPLPTSLRIETARSVHAYLLACPGMPEAVWSQTQQGLVARFDGDPKLVNKSRVMRLPGFDHLAMNGSGVIRTPVKIVQFEPSRKYVNEEFLREFPAPTAQVSQSVSKTAAAGSDQGEYPDWDSLNAELARRLIADPSYKEKGEWGTAKGRCHDGQSDTAIHRNLLTGKIHCKNEGCRYSDILRAFGLPERPTGDPIKDDLLSQAGLSSLKDGDSIEAVTEALRKLGDLLKGADKLTRESVKLQAQARLKNQGFDGCGALVKAALWVPAETADDLQGKAITFVEPEPWPEPVGGAGLLSEISALLTRFIILPEGATTAISLWVLQTYLIDAADVLPILAVTSPEKRCGKTRLLEMLAGIVSRPLPASNISPAAIFRVVEKTKPTLLIDEVDTVLEGNEELRGLLNSGHTRATAYVVRSCGDEHEPRTFSTWGCKTLAKIGKLPDTLEDRSIMIQLKRKNPQEKTARFTSRKMEACLGKIQQKCSRWAKDNLVAVRDADPEGLPFLHDRANDNWRHLFAIADVAGGEWPTLARRCAEIQAGSIQAGDGTVRVQLLSDLKVLFETRGVDRIPSADIIQSLTGMEDRPWPDYWHGKQLTTRQLASLLKPFGIKPVTIRIGGETPKGYLLADCEDAFTRYLADIFLNLSSSLSQSATSDTPMNTNDLDGSSIRNTDFIVADEKISNSNVINNVADVAVRKGEINPKREFDGVEELIL